MELAQTRYGPNARSLRWHQTRIFHLPADSATARTSARPKAPVEGPSMTSDQLLSTRPDLFVVKDGD